MFDFLFKKREDDDPFVIEDDGEISKNSSHVSLTHKRQPNKHINNLISNDVRKIEDHQPLPVPAVNIAEGPILPHRLHISKQIVNNLYYDSVKLIEHMRLPVSAKQLIEEDSISKNKSEKPIQKIFRYFSEIRVVIVFTQNRLVFFKYEHSRNVVERSIETDSIISDVYLCQNNDKFSTFLVMLQDNALFYILTHDFELLNPNHAIPNLYLQAGIYSTALNRLICIDERNDLRLIGFSSEKRIASNIKVDTKNMIKRGLKRVKDMSSYIPFFKTNYDKKFQMKIIGDRVLILKTKRSVNDGNIQNQRLTVYRLTARGTLEFGTRIKMDQVWKQNQRLLESYYELLTSKIEVTDFIATEYSETITLLINKGLEIEISENNHYILRLIDYKVSCDRFVSTSNTTFSKYIDESTIIVESGAYKYFLVKNGIGLIFMQTNEECCLFYNEDLCKDRLQIITTDSRQNLFPGVVKFMVQQDNNIETYSLPRRTDLLTTLLYFEHNNASELQKEFYIDFFHFVKAFGLVNMYQDLYSILLDNIEPVEIDYEYLDYLIGLYGLEKGSHDKRKANREKDDMFKGVYKFFMLFYNWSEQDITIQTENKDIFKTSINKKLLNKQIQKTKNHLPSYIAFRSLLDKIIKTVDNRALVVNHYNRLRANVYLRNKIPEISNYLLNITIAIKMNLTYFSDILEYINFESVYRYVKPEIKHNLYGISKALIDPNLLTLNKRTTNLLSFLACLFSNYNMVDKTCLLCFENKHFGELLTNSHFDAIIRNVIIQQNTVFSNCDNSFFDYYLSINEVDALNVLNDLTRDGVINLLKETKQSVKEPIDDLLLEKAQRVEFSILLSYLEAFWNTGKFDLFCRICLARLTNNNNYINTVKTIKSTEKAYLSEDNQEIRTFICDILIVLLKIERNTGEDVCTTKPLSALKQVYRTLKSLLKKEQKTIEDQFNLEKELLQFSRSKAMTLLNLLVDISLKNSDEILRSSILTMLLEFRSTYLVDKENVQFLKRPIQDILSTSEFNESWINQSNINFLLKHAVAKGDYESAISLILTIANSYSKSLKLKRFDTKDFANMMNDSTDNIKKLQKEISDTKGLRTSELNSYIIDAKGYINKLVIKDDKTIKMIDSLHKLSSNIKMNMIIEKEIEEKIKAAERIIKLNNVKINKELLVKYKVLLETVLEYIGLNPDFENSYIDKRIVSSFKLYGAKVRINELNDKDDDSILKSFINDLFYCGSFNTIRNVANLELYMDFNYAPMLRKPNDGDLLLYEAYIDVPVSSTLDELSNKGLIYPDNLNKFTQTKVGEYLRTASRENKLALIDLIEKLNVNNEGFLHGLQQKSQDQWSKAKASQLWHLFLFLMPEFTDIIIFHELLDLYRAVFNNTAKNPKLNLMEKHQLYKLMDTFLFILEKIIKIRKNILRKPALTDTETHFIKEYAQRKQLYKNFMVEACAQLPTKFEFNELYFTAFNIISRKKALMDVMDTN